MGKRQFITRKDFSERFLRVVDHNGPGLGAKGLTQFFHRETKTIFLRQSSAHGGPTAFNHRRILDK